MPGLLQRQAVAGILGALWVAAAAAAPARTTPAPGSCSGCHKTWEGLPKRYHADLRGGMLSACLSCHSERTTEAELDPFTSKLHRAHLPPDVECTLCHVRDKNGSFGLVGRKERLGKVPAGYQDLRAAVLSWAGSSFLDARHGKGNVGCAGCHAAELPERGAEVRRDRCLACHGPEDQLVARSTPAEHKDRNPHRSHLGEIECTVCHHAHAASENYCLGCHPKFEMKLPEQKQPQPKQ